VILVEGSENVTDFVVRQTAEYADRSVASRVCCGQYDEAHLSYSYESVKKSLMTAWLVQLTHFQMLEHHTHSWYPHSSSLLFPEALFMK
jgi:hypothetical protein